MASTIQSPARIDYFEFAQAAARQQAASTAPPFTIESLTISPDVMRHHYIARAVILDLQPTHVVEAVATTMERIHAEHPHAVRTGWTACNDGLRVYFYRWSALPSVARQSDRRAA